MKQTDPMSLTHEAMRNVLQRLVESKRKTEASLLTAPAVGEQMTRDEQYHDYLAKRGDPYFARGMIEEAALRYPGKLSPEKPIPRAAVTWWLENEKLYQERQEQQ